MVKQIVVLLDRNGETEKILAAQESRSRRMGSLKGQKLISDGYDIDECNDEIAKMFGDRACKGNHHAGCDVYGDNRGLAGEEFLELLEYMAEVLPEKQEENETSRNN